MHVAHALRRALPACALAFVVTATPAIAFEPSVLVFDGGPGDAVSLTDIAGRGEVLAVTSTITNGPARYIVMNRSDDGGATWEPNFIASAYGLREPQVTNCAGHAVAIYRTDQDQPATQWGIQTLGVDLDTGSPSFTDLQGPGVFRIPDVACLANEELVSAMFKKSDGTWRVRVQTSNISGAPLSAQSFSLGTGTPSKGLAIATSSSRVYVAWFDGTKLKLRRFSIGGTASHTLTSLGTTTIATLQYGLYPEIGADGDRVVLAYMDRADLKARRSTNKGASFGGATTIRDEAFPGEIGAYPVNVAVRGSKVAIGALEISEGSRKGLGYRSTNGGSSYSKVTTRNSGNILAGLVRIGSTDRYAEAYDYRFSDPEFEDIRFRRQ